MKIAKSAIGRRCQSGEKSKFFPELNVSINAKTHLLAMATLNNVIRKLEQMENLVRQIVLDNEELKFEVKTMRTEIKNLNKVSSAASAELETSNKPNAFAAFRGVLPIPNSARTSKQTSFFSVGKAMKKGIEDYNKEATHKIPQITQTDISFSRTVMKSAERFIGVSKVFGPNMGKATFYEIRDIFGNDAQTFQNAHENIVRKLCRLHAILTTAEGNWGANSALKRRLIVLKEAAKKEDVNNKAVTKKKENAAKRNDDAKVVEADTRSAACDSLGKESDSAWKYDGISQNSGSDTYHDTADDATEEICALHPYAVDCDLCADNEDIWIPNAILKARNFPLDAGSHIPISIAAVKPFHKPNLPTSAQSNEENKSFTDVASGSEAPAIGRRSLRKKINNSNVGQNKEQRRVQVRNKTEALHRDASLRPKSGEEDGEITETRKRSKRRKLSRVGAPLLGHAKRRS